MYTVLEKYHQVPNGLEDLKSQFHFLTEATSKNVENLQQAINLQQTYSTALCGHVNVIFLRLTKIETEIQNLAEKFKTDQDNIQIDALDFDPDIDGPDNQWVHHTTAGVSVHELLSLPHPETADASFPEEGIADRDQFDTRIPLQKIPIGLAISPKKFQTIYLQIVQQDHTWLQQQNTTFLMKYHK